MQSVASQTVHDFEYIVVDGASIDDSVDVISHYMNIPNLKWISEPDFGIYNAMNKGIKMASGDYTMILNSGDCLASDNVVEKLLPCISEKHAEFLYGNMIKVWPDGRKLRTYVEDDTISMLTFYQGTLDHDGACIKKSLYERLGYYDETFKICSDWEWVMNAVVFSKVKPIHVDFDIILFDMSGISENDGKMKSVIYRERRQVLEKVLPAAICCDYDRYAQDIYRMRRIRRHGLAFKVVNLIERVLFKIEKRQSKRKQEQVWN